MTVEEMEKEQPLTAVNLAILVRILRDARQWSQDTLSALSRLNVRTIQRVENGKPSSADTRRALALAFELEDTDIFNKPLNFPSREQIQAEQERFNREASMHSFKPAVALEGPAAESFAGLVDYLRDFGECADCMSETDKLGASKDVQGYLDALGKAGFSISYARRDTKLMGQNWVDKTPLPMTIAYVVVFPKGSEPKVIFAPRQLTF